MDAKKSFRTPKTNQRRELEGIESVHGRRRVFESLWIKKGTLEEHWCRKIRLGELQFVISFLFK